MYSYAHSLVIPVPGPVQGLVVVSVMERKLNISWEEPTEPNDYTLNYTVTITDISTGTELSRTVVLDMDKDKFTILSDTIGMTDVTNYLECVNVSQCSVILCLMYFKCFQPLQLTVVVLDA